METQYQKLLERIEQIDPLKYGKHRNFLWGPVTQLSPYISRGVISTRTIAKSLFNRGFKSYELERLMQQLTWRDYFQRTAQRFPRLSQENVKNDPTHFQSTGIPQSLVSAETGIDALDEGIEQLLETGWIHNHMRMYLSMLHSNVARCDWRSGARWMYYHLLDADMASNDLSWQWVCGANSNKQYVANQENINKYSGSKQIRTFLDIDYEAFSQAPIPQQLSKIQELSILPTEKVIDDLKSAWPILSSGEVRPNGVNPILLYTWNNLDPLWHAEDNYRRILFLDADEFKSRPVSKKTLEFVFALSVNIPHIELVYGTFQTLQAALPNQEFIYKEHPTQSHWKGIEESRDWIFPEVTEYTPSFFGYWKKCEKYLRQF